MIINRTYGGHIPRIAFGILAFIIVMAAYTGGASAASQSSKNIGYVNYDDSGFTGNSIPSGNIFAISITDGPPSATLTNDSVIYNNMTFTPLTRASLSSTTLAPYDTLILFQVCDIATSLNAFQHAAINDYLAKGNKILLFDGDRCAAPGPGVVGEVGGVANYSWFTYPFSTSSPGPRGAQGTLTIVENSTLTAGLANDPFDKDELGDANTVTTSDTHWFAAANTTNALGNYGYFLAYVPNSPGLIIYDGADYWYTGGRTKSLTDLFLNELNQQFNPDQLPGTVPIAPTVHITANPPTHGINVSTNFTFTANPTGSWGNNISYSWSITTEKCFTAAVILTGQNISEHLDVACGNATISVIAEDEKQNTANDTYLVTVHENVTPPTPAPTFNISGYKINGTDNNGSGIPNWTIDLSNATGAQIASTTTDSIGFYIFSNLKNDTYTVNEVIEPNWTNLSSTSQIVNISGADVNNVNFTNALIPPPPIPQPPPPPAPTFSITGTVFIDTNQNGVQDNGEQGYSGATVTLTTGQSVTTDAKGNYAFSNLPSGTYVVALTVPDGYNATTQSLVDIELNKNVIQNFGIVPTTIINPLLGSISGYKIDAVTGMGIPNWKIKLQLIIGDIITTHLPVKDTTTDDQGFYKFDNLPAGKYILTEEQVYPYVPKTSVITVTLAPGEDSKNNNFTNL